MWVIIIMLLSYHERVNNHFAEYEVANMCFTFANAVNVCADLAWISVLDPSSLMIAPMYLNYFAVSSVLVNWQLCVI